MFRRKRYIFATKKDHRWRNFAIVVVCLAALAAAFILFVYPVLRPIHYSVQVEAGTGQVAPEDFLKHPGGQDQVVLNWEEWGEPDWNVPGEYQIKVAYEEKSYNAKINVVDTVAPKAQAKAVTYLLDQDQELTPMDFVEDLEDATEVTAVYEKEPDLTQRGSQPVTIILTDLGGNETKVTAELTVTDDQQPPVIYGAVDRLTYLGIAIPLDDGIAVVDDQDPAPVLQVDSSAVDFNQRGTYPVTYRATDRAGNTVEATVQLTVSYARQSAVGMDTLNAAIDQLLSEIVTEDMTAEQKCRAVYDWAKTNIRWSNSGSDKTAWTKEAYRGVSRKSGDSYTTSAFFHACMLRLGFQDMIVQREGAYYYWNLVNLGDGWRHVDCGRGSGNLQQPVFLLNGEELAACSAEAGNGFYEFDSQAYPPAGQK